MIAPLQPYIRRKIAPARPAKNPEPLQPYPEKEKKKNDPVIKPKPAKLCPVCVAG